MFSAILLSCFCVATNVHPEEQAFLEASTFDPDSVLQMAPEELQQRFNAFTPPPCEIEISLVRDQMVPTEVGDVPCRFYHPDPETPLPLLVWFHGGGWVLGTLDQADATCRLLAQRGHMAVLSVDYPLAPQHPFPAAVTACEAVTRWALTHRDELVVQPGVIAVGGDSAGGNLAAVTAATLGDRLTAQFLVYPALDALAQTASRRDFARGYMLHADHMDWFYDSYVPDRSLWGDPRVSPLRAASQASLPRTVLMVAQVDVLRDEAVQYALVLSQAGISVDLLMAPGLLHGFASRWTRSQACRAEFERGIDLFANLMHGSAPSLGHMLDLNQDGTVEPFEAADAIGTIADSYEMDEIHVADLMKAARAVSAWDRMEIHEIWADMNSNGDNWLDASELPDEFAPLASEFDRDKNRRLSFQELLKMRDLEGPLFVHMEVANIFAEYDADRDGQISLKEASQLGDAVLIEEADLDENGWVGKSELLEVFSDWEPSLSFEVRGTEAVAAGTIDASTPGRLMQLIMEYPEVDTIVLQEVPGSMDDDANLVAGRLLRHHGLATHVPAAGEIASGGVDLFLAGVNRTIEPGARLGVHSWGGLGEAGDAMDRAHEAHDMYLQYGRDMGITDDFYWFTLEAAGPDEIHWMRPEEIERFGLITESRSSKPQSDVTDLDFGLTPIPQSEAQLLREGFTKQTAVIAPSGKPIRIIAQAGVPDIAVARARNLLTFFLTDVPGTQFGANKTAVANAMAENNAMLMMPTGAHEEGNEPHVDAQPLFEYEAPVDGSRWYLQNDWNHRDAGFEEIFHLVHDAGIGTWLPGALPEYQQQLDAEARAAMQDGRWGINIDPEVRGWLQELEAEDSLAQEYIASAIDSYYGLWAAFDERPGGMWGIYTAKTRDEMATRDPKGIQLIEAFLPPMMNGYEALIDPAFEGDFLMSLDEAHPYTHKSRYYVQATLTGDADNGLIGNDADNLLRGNRGDNRLDGGRGHDIVEYMGPRSDYELTDIPRGVQVRDRVNGRDGTDRLIDIEVIRFADGDLAVLSD